MTFKVPFTPGTTTAPNEKIGATIGTLFGYFAWAVVVAACFALLGCAAMAWSNHRQGQTNEGVTKAGWVLGAVLSVGLIVGVVGTVSGT